MASILETDAARQWLLQFKEQDIDAARAMLHGMHFVSQNMLESAWKNELDEICQSDSNVPVAIYAIREIDKIIPEHGRLPVANVSKGSRYLMVGGEKVAVTQDCFDTRSDLKPEPYFDPVAPAKNPDRLRLGASVGSEGPTANFIRDYCQASQEKSIFCLDHPSINKLLNAKVRRIVLLDDVIGSGERLRQFLWAFFSNKTIRSWASGKHIRVSTCVFGCSESQREKILNDWRVDEIRYRQLLRAGSSLWKSGEEEEVRRVCKKYARLTKRSWWSLGFNEAFTFIAFEHKVPNTNPAILWARGKEWKPLFPNRPRLIGEDWPTSATDADVAASVLSAARNRPLAEAIENGQFACMERDVLVALTLLRRPACDSLWLERKLEWSPQKTAAIVAFCETRGWYSAATGVSDTGREELARIKKLNKKHRPDDMPAENGYYFPKSLRGSRNHS